MFRNNEFKTNRNQKLTHSQADNNKNHLYLISHALCQKKVTQKQNISIKRISRFCEGELFLNLIIIIWETKKEKLPTTTATLSTIKSSRTQILTVLSNMLTAKMNQKHGTHQKFPLIQLRNNRTVKHVKDFQ